MRSPAFLVFVSLLALLAVGGSHAQAYEISLAVKVAFGSRYDFGDEPWPSTVDAGVSFTASLSAGGNSFPGVTGTRFVAAQGDLTDLTVMSPNDLTAQDLQQYATTTVSSSFSDAFASPGSWATFFVFSDGPTSYATPIFYYDIVDYSAQPQSWDDGPGWDGVTPFVFVNVVRRFVEFSAGPGLGERVRGSEAWGLDVVEASAPQNESSLEILLSDQSGGFLVKRLFPLTVHAAAIDGPVGNGAVVEPSISLDGNWVLFTYFHDVHDVLDNTYEYLHKKGADIYAINLAPLLANHTADPSTLTFHRITSTNQQDPASKNADAMNPQLAADPEFAYGRIFMHAIETKLGGTRKLVFVSNQRRLANSNDNIEHGNHNFNLFEAKFNFSSGVLREVKQIHYYTTTSALSPAAMRDGFSFAYQSTTEEARSWEVQITKSNYQWSPGVGYGGNGQTAFHLQTLVPTSIATGVEDWLVTCLYYNANNNGFGTLVANPASKLGKNEERYVSGDWLFGSREGLLPHQLGLYNVMIGVDAEDDPGDAGKLTAPRGGRTNELFASYSPHSSTNLVPDGNLNRGYYDSYLVSLPNVSSKLNGSARWETTDLQMVLDDDVKWRSQIWGVPVLSHFDRFGEDPQTSPQHRAVSEVAHYAANPSEIHGMPYAVIGASSLSNTDMKSHDERLASANEAYDFATLSGPQRIHIQNNVAGLSRVLTDASGAFRDVSHDDILGVAVQLTSNKTDFPARYQTAGSDPYAAGGLESPNQNGNRTSAQELTRLLGVYDVQGNPGEDDSFMATIPANAPIELQLLDKQYGLRLADQRSWKSFKSGEVRRDCGGCHNHVGAAVAFEGTHADGSAYVPQDMVNSTKYITYDQNCVPTLHVDNVATRPIPEYYETILPGLRTYVSTQG